MALQGIRRGASAPGPVTGPRGAGRGVLAMLVSGTSNQFGAAIGALAFGAIGPAGVVAVRQFITAAVLLPLVRPPLRRFTRAQWWPVLCLGLVFGTMNLSLYTAVDRIGLGLAVTLEFLGPLAIALAGSRRVVDVLCAVGAALGVYVLVQPGPATDFLGVGLGLLAATCWAGYILLNRLVGQRLPGLQGTAASSAVSSAMFVPVMITVVLAGGVGVVPLLCAAAAGVLSSIVPYVVDLTVLRTVPTRFFGVFMSVYPVLAVLAGLVVLHQVPSLHQVVGVTVVVAANAVSVGTLRPARPTPPGPTPP